MGCWRSLYLQLQRLCHSFCLQGSGLNSSWASEHGWGGINHLVFEEVMNTISINNTLPLQLYKLTWGPPPAQKYFLPVQPIQFRSLCAVLLCNIVPSALLPSKAEFLLPCLRCLWLIEGPNTDQESWEFFHETTEFPRVVFKLSLRVCQYCYRVDQGDQNVFESV